MDIKFNVKSIFKIDESEKKELIEKFNYKLLKIILCLETGDGTN